jgi:SAM-dependent methyltransferase
LISFRKSMIAAVVCGVVLSSSAWAQTAARNSTFEPSVGQQGKDVIWVPTPQALVDRMLDLAEVSADDYLVDLGSGDGRTVITAARRGARAHGVEFNPDMVNLSKRGAQVEGVATRATFEQGDIFETDFSKATVVTLFLLPKLNLRLRPTLLDMKPGTRVVSNSFNMDDWQPDAEVTATENCTRYCSAYKWIVPAKVEGKWKMEGQELELKQSFQMLEGALRQGGTATPLKNGRLEGTRIVFNVGNDRFTGQVDGNTMKGTLGNGSAWSATRSR